MHRIDRDTLFFRIHNLIQCSRRKRHKTIPIVHSLESHAGQKALAQLICEAIDNDSIMVIQAEFLTHKQRLGTWGIDEPIPATVPETPLPKRPER